MVIWRSSGQVFNSFQVLSIIVGDYEFASSPFQPADLIQQDYGNTQILSSQAIIFWLAAMKTCTPAASLACVCYGSALSGCIGASFLKGALDCM